MLSPLLLLCFLAPQSPALADISAFAPPAHEIDGVRGVPIDIQSVTGSLTFDLKKRSKKASAEMVFQTLETGYPIFDLRQDIDSAVLDFKPIKPELMKPHQFGPQTGSMRILEREVRAGANSILQLRYDMNKPLAPSAQPALKRENGLFFTFNFTDLKPGRYLEQWFPANLIYDQFEFTLKLQLKNAEQQHLIVTNAEINKLGRHHWELTWPSHTTSFSPMLVIVPKEDVEFASKDFKLKNGQAITVEITKEKNSYGTMEKAFDEVERGLKDFTKGVGDWPHDDRYTLYVRNSASSMEYDGATCTAMGAIRHETFHSWFGRGVKPRSQNDAWWDEAWDVWFADNGRYANRTFSMKDKAVQLCSSNPWNRITSSQSYGRGAQVFARLAQAIGEANLRKHMSAFFNEFSLKTASTQDLEEFLTTASKSADVEKIFSKFVYGIADED